MRKILVPTDFTDLSYNAIQVATTMAKSNASELTLLHVIELSSHHSLNIEGEILKDSTFLNVFTVELIDKMKERMAELLQDPIFENLTVKTLFKIGKPSRTITDTAKEEGSDLIVMGTMGSSGLQELLVGSNTERVVRNAPCPVLSINQSTREFQLENIVLATTMDKWEAKIIDYIRQLQHKYGSTIHLVWVNTMNNFQTDTITRERLKNYAGELQLENYTLNVFNDTSEEEGLINFAKSIDADLIAMNTHGFKGLSRLLAGSIAENVVNQASFPVLTMTNPTP